MRYFLLLVFFFLSFGQLQRISFFNQAVNFYFYEFFLVGFCFFAILKFKKQLLLSAFSRYQAMGIFLIILLISYLLNFFQFNIFENLVGFLYFFRLIFYCLFFLSLSLWLEIDKNNFFYLKKSLQLFIFLTMIATTIQYFFYPNLRNLLYLGWDPHYYRTFGVFFDTAVAGAIYGLIFFISNNVFIKSIFLLFLIFSFARNIYLGFIISLFYWFLILKKNFFINFILMLMIILTVIFLIPKPEGEGGKLTRVYTITARFDDWQKGIKLFLKKPFFGYGYNRIRFLKNQPSSHAGGSFSSSFLTVFVTSGIVGFLGFIKLLLDFWRLFPEKRPLLIFLILVSLFDNIFFHPFILVLFFSSLFDKKL